MVAECEKMGRVPRSSNIELYRIIWMFMIVAHHFVVNSGLTLANGPMLLNPGDGNTIFLWLYGMWGKTGINAFLLITGYFMCKSRITLKKFLKLMLWIYTYKIIIFGVFLFMGYESITLKRIIKLIMPVWGFNSNFTSCFMGFWLTIPFWNILIHNMTKKQHQLLLALLLFFYTVLGSIPKFYIAFNYITWFGIIYLIASYIRYYPSEYFEKKFLWGMVSLGSIIIAGASAIGMHFVFGRGETFFVSDCNKIFAVIVAVSTFLWFKNINLSYSKVINIIGGSTFGVFLIHANSDAMRQWLWKDMIDCVGHYGLPLPQLIGFSVGVVLLIFFLCTIIDIIRIKLLEEPFFKYFDTKLHN